MPESIQPEAGTTPLQFAALLDLEANADWPALEAEVASALQRGGLKPHQKAELLLLQATALRHQGQSQSAEELQFQSLSLRCSPATALDWLQQQWPKLAEESAAEHWLKVCHMLVEGGHQAALIRGVMSALGHLPLQTQRQRLITALEDADALKLQPGSPWQRQWTRLKQASPAGGMGFWS